MSEQRDRSIRRVARTRAGLVGGAAVASLSIAGALAVTGALHTSADAGTTTSNGTTSSGTTSSGTTSSGTTSSDSSSSQGLVGQGDSSSTSHATTAGS